MDEVTSSGRRNVDARVKSGCADQHASNGCLQMEHSSASMFHFHTATLLQLCTVIFIPHSQSTASQPSWTDECGRCSAAPDECGESR